MESTLADMLSCPVCMETFRDPMSLGQCGHTFCRACLAALPRPKACPTCRQAFRDQDVKPNFVLRHVVEKEAGVTGTVLAASPPVAPLTPDLSTQALRGYNGSAVMPASVPQASAPEYLLAAPIAASRMQLQHVNRHQHSQPLSMHTSPPHLMHRPGPEHRPDRLGRNAGGLALGCLAGCFVFSKGSCCLPCFGGVVGALLGRKASKQYHKSKASISLPISDGAIGAPDNTLIAVELWNAGSTAPLTHEGMRLVARDERPEQLYTFFLRVLTNLNLAVVDKNRFTNQFLPRCRGNNTTRASSSLFSGPTTTGGLAFSSFEEALTQLQKNPEACGCRSVFGKRR